MKEFIKGMIFWFLVLVFIFTAWKVAEFLISVITMQFIIKIMIVIVVLGAIYILREIKKV